MELNKVVKKLEIKNKKLEEDSARLLEAIKNISSIEKEILNNNSDSIDMMKTMANDGVLHITREQEDIYNNNMNNIRNQEDEPNQMGGGLYFLVDIFSMNIHKSVHRKTLRLRKIKIMNTFRKIYLKRYQNRNSLPEHNIFSTKNLT